MSTCLNLLFRLQVLYTAPGQETPRRSNPSRGDVHLALLNLPRHNPPTVFTISLHHRVLYFVAQFHFTQRHYIF